MTDRIRYAITTRPFPIISGRNHDAGRPRHRLVRAEGTRFRLAHAAALEPDSASAVADEWLVVGHGRGTEEDHAPPLHGQEGHEWTQDDPEAVHRPPPDPGEARNRQP